MTEKKNTIASLPEGVSPQGRSQGSDSSKNSLIRLTQSGARGQSPLGRTPRQVHDKKDAPENIRLAARLWYLTAFLQAVNYIVAGIMHVQNPSTVRSQVQTADLNIPEGVSESQFFSMIAMTQTVMMLAIVVLFVFVISGFYRGSSLARTFLTIGSFFLLLSAVVLFLGGADVNVPVGYTIALGILTIFAAVSAMTAWYFSGRSDSRAYLDLPSQEELIKMQNELRENARKEREQQQAKKDQKKKEKQEKKSKEE